MHVAAVNGDNGRCRIEILVFYLTKFTAINRVSKPGAKISTKPVCSAANLIRVKPMQIFRGESLCGSR